MVTKYLPSEETVFMTMQLDEAASAAKTVYLEADSLKRAAEKVLSAHKSVESDAMFLESKSNRHFVRRVMEAFYRGGFLRVRSAYDAIITPNSARGLLNPSDIQSENFDQSLREAEGVYSFVYNDKILIKLPMLPVVCSRKKVVDHIEKGADFRAHSSFFVKSLDESLRKLDRQITPFSEQNITYIFAFGPSEASKADCDNIDTKYITDTICQHTFCDDMADKTSFFLTGAKVKQEDIGTYICVSPSRFSIPHPDEIIGIIRQKILYQKTAI